MRILSTQTALAPSLRPLALLLSSLCLALPSVAQDDGKDAVEKPKDEKAAPADAAPEAPDAGLVRALDREPRAGTPLIANKQFPMQFTLEITPAFDYAYSEKFLQHVGGHLSLGFHIFDWLGVEAFAGGFYPSELAITKTVRQRGYSYTSCSGGDRCDPKLSDLWQSFAFAGAVVQWAPLYGKLSIVSEFDLAFQLYFLGGLSVEGTAKPVSVPGAVVSNTNDFYPGVASGTQFEYNPRFSATYGGGIRLIPWKWVALRMELRNFTGLNPPVEGVDDQPLDISNLPQVSFGISLLI